MKRPVLIAIVIAGIIAVASLGWMKHTLKAAIPKSETDSTSLSAPLGSPIPAVIPQTDATPLRVAESTSTDSSQPSQANTGPAPLSIANEQRLDDFAKSAATKDPKLRDVLELARTEKPDPDWSSQVERLLRQSVERNGSKLTAIQASAPHCTRTVCVLSATGGLNTAAANADWQSLMSALMNEPWFPRYFSDTGTTVQPDPKGILYISYFVRKS